MNTTVPTRPPDLQLRHVRLAREPAAVPAARCQVEAAIRSWRAPVDADVAVLLTSELVTNALQHAAGQTILLVISHCRGRLRVDVHDSSRAWPVVADTPADAESGRGLLLVATLSAEWGCHRTPAGKAVYFTLAPQPGPDPPPAPG